jgi:hypothetical protein
MFRAVATSHWTRSSQEFIWGSSREFATSVKDVKGVSVCSDCSNWPRSWQEFARAKTCIVVLSEAVKIPS